MNKSAIKITSSQLILTKRGYQELYKYFKLFSKDYSTVTDLAKLRGLSTSRSLCNAA